MKLIEGRRVYIPSKKTFGKIIRDGGILGLSNSFAILDDTGNRMVFMDKVPEFVYADTKQNVSGEAKEIPEDVVPMFKKNLTHEKCTKMTEEYYKLSEEERKTVCMDWMNCDLAGGNHPEIIDTSVPVVPMEKPTPVEKKKFSVKY